MNRPSRRDVLEVGSAGFLAGLAGCSGLDEVYSSENGTIASESDVEELSREELVARIEALEETIAAKTERIDELESRVETNSSARAEFSRDVFDQAERTARDARNAVVTVRGSRGAGTGWVLNAEQGHIVTNSHVVADETSFTIETFEGRTDTATRVGYHRNLTPDVALVQTDLAGLSEFSTGDESTLTEGDPLLTVGHPGRYGDWIMSIGRFDSYSSFSDWVLSTVPTSQGNSGGPLFTLDGDVVGVVSGTTSGERRDYSKSDELYAEFPDVAEFTTSTPVTTLMDSVDEWVA